MRFFLAFASLTFLTLLLYLWVEMTGMLEDDRDDLGNRKVGGGEAGCGYYLFVGAFAFVLVYLWVALFVSSLN